MITVSKFLEFDSDGNVINVWDNDRPGNVVEYRQLSKELDYFSQKDSIDPTDYYISADGVLRNSARNWKHLTPTHYKFKVYYIIKKKYINLNWVLFKLWGIDYNQFDLAVEVFDSTTGAKITILPESLIPLHFFWDDPRYRFHKFIDDSEVRERINSLQDMYREIDQSRISYFENVPEWLDEDKEVDVDLSLPEDYSSLLKVYV